MQNLQTEMQDAKIIDLIENKAIEKSFERQVKSYTK